MRIDKTRRVEVKYGHGPGDGPALHYQLTDVVGAHARVVGPGAISVPPRTQLQPDILAYPSRFNPETDWVKVTEHWLAVEVLSLSSRIYDREFKRDAYFALGVGEVWLVDIRDHSVEVCRGRGAGEVVRELITWRVPTLGSIVPIPPVAIFAGIE